MIIVEYIGTKMMHACHKRKVTPEIQTNLHKKVKTRDSVTRKRLESYDLLPDEVWIMILDYSQFKEIGLLQRVCKRLYGICTDLDRWKQIKNDSISEDISVNKLDSFISKVGKVGRTESIFLHRVFIHGTTAIYNTYFRPVSRWFSTFDEQSLGILHTLDLTLNRSLSDSLLSTLDKLTNLKTFRGVSTSGEWPYIFSSYKTGKLRLEHLTIEEHTSFSIDITFNICLFCDADILKELVIVVPSINIDWDRRAIFKELHSLEVSCKSIVRPIRFMSQIQKLKLDINSATYTSFIDTLGEYFPNLKILDASLNCELLESTEFEFRHLERLSLKGIKYLNQSTFHKLIASCTNVRELILDGVSNIKKYHLDIIFETFPNLDVLDIQNTRISEDVRNIPLYLTRLKRLCIGSEYGSVANDINDMETTAQEAILLYHIDDSIISSLSEMQCLEYLKVAGYKITGNFYASQNGWTSLKCLDVSLCENLQCGFIHKGNFERTNLGKNIVKVTYPDKLKKLCNHVSHKRALKINPICD